MMIALIANIVIFQIAWFSAVISAGHNVPWIGTTLMLSAVVFHIVRAERPGPELLLVLVCGLIGAVWDSLLVASGWITYPSGSVMPGLAPYWIIAMWMLFATTLNISVGWLKSSRVLAALFGGIGGPLSYYTGSKLGGVIFVDQTAALIALGVGWATLMPILLSLATRYDGVSVRAEPAHGWILD
jgi:hypothetical protein